MHSSSEVIREQRDGFRSISGLMAPRPAVAAFLAIAPAVESVAFTEWTEPGNKGGSRWTLVGAPAGSLVVVTAFAPVTWSWQDFEEPDGATVTAQRLPLRRVSGIALEEVRANLDRSFDAGELWGYARWVIELDNGDAIRLNGQEDRHAEDQAAEFCLSLLDQLAG